MEILYRGFYQIDYKGNKIIQREINEGFDVHIKSLINFILKNESVQRYKIRSNKTEVVNILESWLKNYIIQVENEDVNDLYSEQVKNYVEGVAERLLRIERQKQEEYKHLKHEITKGNLLISLIKNEESHIFLLSKVNNSFFIDDRDLNEKTGFSSKDKNIWKTTVFDYNIGHENEIEINNIKVYLKEKAQYWWNDFLEIDKMQNDEINTNIAHTNIEKVLTNMLKRKAPRDYFCLSNAVIGYMKKGERIDYSTMITEIFSNYQGEDIDKEDIIKIVTRLEKLPEEKQFDRQFVSVPSEVKSKVKRFYPVSNGIEIKINGPIDDTSIEAKEDEKGNKFIQIKTTDLETFNTFKNKKVNHTGEGEVDDR